MEWISVKDRLPKIDEHVIGYAKIGEEWQVIPLLYQYFRFHGHDSKYEWAYLFAYNEGYDYAKEVTHWMPLPNPPKEKNDHI